MEKENFDFRAWLARFDAGDASVATELFEAYYQRLVRLAQKRLANMPPQVADGEGAAISALRSFFSGINNGQFSRIDNEHDLWRLLATITARKAVRQLRQHWKQSGEADRVRRNRDLNQLLSAEDSPEDEAILIESYEQCLRGLEDPTLTQIARLRLNGSDTKEIADLMSLHVRSVQRKLNLIESIWNKIIADES